MPVLPEARAQAVNRPGPRDRVCRELNGAGAALRVPDTSSWTPDEVGTTKGSDNEWSRPLTEDVAGTM